MLQVLDLLKDYPAFQQYSRNGLDLCLEYYWADNLPQDVQDWAFALCKTNMEDIYNTAWGWKDDTKREELAASEARFLVAYDQVLSHASTGCDSLNLFPVVTHVWRSSAHLMPGFWGLSSSY